MDVATSGSHTDVTNLMRPRIAMAQDGSYAIAYEAEVAITERLREWQLFLQLHDASGANIGPQHRLEPESLCSTFDSWSADFVDDADMVFRHDGILLVTMSHSGWFSLGGVDDLWEIETTLAAIAANGQQIDLNDSANCMQHKLNFIGATKVERPRIAAATDGSFLIVQDGYFDDDNAFGEAVWRNSALRIFNGDGSVAIEQLTVHDDPASAQASHWRPDVAMGGNLILVVWQECPIIDNQGNANECDVATQFLQVSDGNLQLLGGNQRVNLGDPAGTINVWPSAAMNASERSVVVWTDNRAGSYEIYAQRFGADGNPIGNNILVSTGNGDTHERPEVAVFDDDRFAIVWDDSSAAGFRAHVRFFDASGRPLTDPMVLLSNSGRHSRSPDIDAAGSWMGIVWKEVEGDMLFVQPARQDINTIVSGEEPVLMSRLAIGSYPSPFHETVELTYELDLAGTVEITLYDMLGRSVRNIWNGHQAAGSYRVPVDASTLAAGAYVVRLRHEGRQETRVILKSQ